jgi:hypothetical protein
MSDKQIKYEQDAKDCELAKSGSCCYCKNFACYQLEEQLEAYKMEAKEGKEINAELNAENEEWKKANDCILTTLNVIAEGNKKLRQTLTEIKAIAKICKCHNAYGCYECKYFDDCEVEDEEIPTRDVCKLILQKISECEGNDD